MVLGSGGLLSRAVKGDSPIFADAKMGTVPGGTPGFWQGPPPKSIAGESGLARVGWVR